MKYKVGEKVKVKDNEIGKLYGNYSFSESMAQYINKEMTIKEVLSCSYKLEEDGNDFSWTDEMLTKPRQKKPSTSESLEKVLVNSISKLSDSMNEVINNGMKEINGSINKRTLYDDVLQKQILDKAKEISLEEIKEELTKSLDDYVKKNFSVIPKKIEIKKGNKTKKMKELLHNKFEEILQIVNANIPLMLTGPAGAGKNYTLEQVAKALDLEFYFTNAITQEYKLTGFIDANGVYQETQFYKAFKDGGLFFLDEVDASVPEALIILNSAIANGYFDFPNGRVNANKNFRVVCAGNTYGTGADMIYVGRNALDGATLDRFVVIPFEYDKEIEQQLAYDDELYEFIVSLRNILKNNSLRYIISMRATINASKMLEIGIDKKEILKTVIVKNMQIDDLNTIKSRIRQHGSNIWENELYQLIEEM